MDNDKNNYNEGEDEIKDNNTEIENVKTNMTNEKDTETLNEKKQNNKNKIIIISVLLILLAIFLISYEKNLDKKDSEKIKSDINITDNNTENVSTFEEITNTVQDNYENYVSMDGYLFDINEGKRVDELFADSLEGKHIISVYPSDILEIKKEEEEDLTLFLVEFKNEKVLITDKAGTEQEISLFEYENVMKKYNHEEEITYYRFHSDVYMELAFMSMLLLNSDENINTDFVNCRYVVSNGDYAVVICSPKDMDNDLHGYIFKLVDGLWEPEVIEYQNFDNYLQFVNNKYGYMDINLLLQMDINKYSKEDFITNLDGVVNGMLYSNVITEEDLPKTYGVMEENLVYIEFSSGKAFVGEGSIEQGITTYPVVDTVEAKMLFDKFNDDAPYIILKQY